MTRIRSRETPDLAMQVLSWVAWTKRPLAVRELQHALAITDGATTLDEDNITDAEDLASSCEGLVTLDSETNMIRLVHYTTQEYLETVRNKLFSGVENDILGVCLEILSSPVFENGPCQTDAEFEERMRQFPLYDYASRHWGDHASNPPTMDEAIFGFLQDVPKVEAASQCMFTYQGHCRSVPTEVTGLHLAALYGLNEATSRLLSSGYGADQQTSYGQSPLFLAAARGSQSTVAILLRHNAQVGSEDVYGRTALSVAAEHGQLEVAKTLIGHGAGVDLIDDFGRSPISDASEAGHEAMVSYLLQCYPNVQPDQKEFSGRTPLWRAAAKGHWGVVRLLAAHGADIDTHLQGVSTPISWAVQKGNRDAIDCLISMGANINLADSEGRAPLSYAAEEGFSSIVEILLANEADPSLTDKDGWTPLMWACDSGKLDAVSLLLQYGCPNMMEHVDRFGQTALSITSRAGHAAIVKLLLQADAQRTTIDMADESGWTPLIQAAKHGSKEVLDLLLDKLGTAGNVSHRDCAGKTALHWAAGLGNVAAVLSLLNAGAVVDAMDSARRTPLWQAARYGHVEAVEALVNAHAAVDAADVLQRSPLRLAIENGHDSIAEILLHHKAELEACAAAEWNFLHVSSLTVSVKVREHVLRVAADAGGEADVLGLAILFT
ncbi:hypothetical protein AUP68_11578 [Ilyonectria robusta]